MVFFCLHWLQICLIIEILHQTRGYLLFAANLDDFRNIAKKFIPQKLADQLAEMASDLSVNYHHKAEEKEVNYESSGSEEELFTKTVSPVMPKDIFKKRYLIKNHIPEVNLDELVEKVRERLLKGKNKPRKKENIANAHKTKYANKKFENPVTSPIEDNSHDVLYSQNTDEEKPLNVEPIRQHYKEVTTKREKAAVKSKIRVKDKQNTDKKDKGYKESINIYTDPIQYENDGKIFHEFDLRNANDSYEDYAVPNKGKIFESEETTTKRRPNRQKTTKTSKRNTSKDYDELKARTESLLYGEKEIRDNRTIIIICNSKNIKKGKVTMIPTREYYKMSSPDYYKKLPVIVEKYNFDEPIPEKDREPENLKSIGNPPARINKKVRV